MRCWHTAIVICLAVGSVARNWSSSSSVSCGTTVLTTANKARVVGGQDAVAGQWPWQAMIQTKRLDTSYEFVCGGTLIHSRLVVSAAHCFTSVMAGVKVILGAVNEGNSFEATRQTRFASFYNHPDYSSVNDGVNPEFYADISLLELTDEVIYNDWVRPACLPSTESVIPSGETCIISGYGETQGTGNADVLQYAEVEIISFNQCKRWYKTYDVNVPDDHICAGYTQGGVDTCQGDSGGPLACAQQSRRTMIYFLRGITSFGIGCAQARRPGVYTDVAVYVGWINNYLERINFGTNLTSAIPECCSSAPHVSASTTPVVESTSGSKRSQSIRIVTLLMLLAFSRAYQLI